ncbi:TonB-dependent receptor [Winogradskyella sp. PG-2]|uniref:TonB-dependent receptor n=1 Tax=Winogradskyella sp. PG-2 TaxID=754409 RepID=UPI0004587A6E|nr:TonB-dependent receptor [Winogradskyella sp. PG-2]BAO74611.1 outer membrane receptor proteins, mostly Fe transport [Winogradskyella sp. PG-2]
MKRILLFLVFMALCSTAFAHEISGTITTENKTPIEGVNIYNKNTGGYAYTNVSGYFELDDISEGDVIVISGLGYEQQEFTITSSQLDTTVNIVLKDAAVSLDQVVLVSKLNVLSQYANVDIKTNPIKSAQEILRKVPGLIIGQHAGGGKAEQIFLRGFDIDHGTDISITTDGLPVNLPSHAHGQGYADLHFVIPETIGNIDFGKGPYYADKGNFNTAGYIELNTKKSIDDNLIKIEAGQYNTLRAVNLFKISEGENSSAYVASELVLTDGVFQSPQNFNRLNVLGRYNFNNYEDEELTLSFSHFQSRWDASGQIPTRAVEQGLIGRFGAIDDTEGGSTSRSNLWVNHTKQIDEHQRIKSKAFLSKYDFELYSNFTFFLEDPVNGDQIKQKESRTILGAESVYNRTFHIEDHNVQLSFDAGLGFRYDDVNDVELSCTKNRRETLERIAFGDIDELNGYAFFSGNYKTKKWTLNPGLRLDYFKFGYVDFLADSFETLNETQTILSPKFNTIFAASSDLQLFAKLGYGFHSNDARVVTANTSEETLPSAFGADLGAIYKPADRLVFNTALWTLFSEQEFVYVGDGGIVEPSGKSKRYGIDFGFRYQITDWLFVNSDVNYTVARSVDEPDGQDFIPLAPDFTSTGSISVKGLKGFSGGLSYRFVDDRPANEDDSIVAEGYFVTDFNINYDIAKNWSIGLAVENLFDVEWNETQFATETRLFNEAQPVEEITFTPGTPFFLRAKIAVTF